MTLVIVLAALALPAAYELLAWLGVVPPVPWRRMTLAFLGRLWPDEGGHSPHAAMTPAPQQRAGQAPRPGDPPTPSGAVRAGATTQPPELPLTAPGTAPETPAPRGAARAGQATSPAAGPPWQPAPLPQPEAGASPLASPGLGQHPSADRRERQPWIIRHQPPTGSLLAIGYEPFHHGPRAVITDPRVSLRVTGALAAIGDGPAAAVRPYAEQWWAKWDEAVNEQ